MIEQAAKWHKTSTIVYPAIPSTGHRPRLIGVEGNVGRTRLFRRRSDAIAYGHAADLRNNTSVDSRVDLYHRVYGRVVGAYCRLQHKDPTRKV